MRQLSLSLALKQQQQQKLLNCCCLKVYMEHAQREAPLLVLFAALALELNVPVLHCLTVKFLHQTIHSIGASLPTRGRCSRVEDLFCVCRPKTYHLVSKWASEIMHFTGSWVISQVQFAWVDDEEIRKFLQHPETVG